MPPANDVKLGAGEPARTSRQRRRSVDELVTIYWRDIPAQVTATYQGEKGSWLLDERFQLAIDRAATVAGLTDADQYVLEWRRVTRPADGDPQAAAHAFAQELQQQYPPERLTALIDSGGLEPSTNGSSPPSESTTP